MNKKIIIFSIIIFLVLQPIVYAEIYQDSISEQIQLNSKNQLIPYIEPGSFEEMLATNPEFRKLVAKFVILFVIISILVIIDMILKGFAMWKAAKNNSKAWFWILLVVSSFGILPLIYLIFIKNQKKQEQKKKK